MQHRYNFQGLSYPVSIHNISKFKKKQPPSASINVFDLDSSNNVYRLRISTNERRAHTELLLITDSGISQYTQIKDFEALVSKQISKKKVRKTTCKKCFCHINRSLDRGGSQWLAEHLTLMQCKRYREN